MRNGVPLRSIDVARYLRRVPVLAPLVVGGVLVVRGAAAREIELAAGCPERSGVEARIASVPSGDRVTRVTIVRGPSSFEGEVVLGEGEGRFVRTVNASTCAAVVDALVLVVSLVRDTEPKPEPAPAPEPEPTPAPVADAAPVVPVASLTPADAASPPPSTRDLEPAPRLRVGMGVESGTMRLGNTAYGVWGGAWFRVLPMLSAGVEAAATGRVPSCPDGGGYGGPMVVPSCRDGRSLQRFVFVPRFHVDLVGAAFGVSAGPWVGVAFSNRHFDVFGYGTRQRGSSGMVWGGQAGLHIGPRWVTVDLPVTVGRAPEGLLADEGTVLFTVGLGVSLHVL